MGSLKAKASSYELFPMSVSRPSLSGNCNGSLNAPKGFSSEFSGLTICVLIFARVLMQEYMQLYWQVGLHDIGKI